MSIQAIAWVLDNSRSTGVDRLVLIALANHANSESGVCHPGQRRIALEANCSRSTVHAALGRLAKLGEVVVTHRGKGHGTNKYHLPWLSTGGPSARPWAEHRESPSARQAGPSARPEPSETVLKDITARGANGYAGAGAPKPPRDAVNHEAKRQKIAELKDELRARRRGPRAS